MMIDWSEWQRFPDPRKKGVLIAPFGPGCYELRLHSTKELILFGRAGHVARRLTSLLPAPLGAGTRNNKEKRAVVLKFLQDMEYRTVATATKGDAHEIENGLRLNRDRYRFPEYTQKVNR